MAKRMGGIEGEAVKGAEAYIVGTAQNVTDQFVADILGLGAVEKERKHPPVLFVWAVVPGDLNEEGFVVNRGGGQEGEKAGGGFAKGEVGGKNIPHGIRSF
jgi:hypothetical protein